MAVYSIKELENLSGIKAHTIRIWEKRYGLIEPYRTTTNIRYYSDQELKKILNVAVLNRNGIKISNIARLTDQELKEEIMRVSGANPSVENIIDSLIVSMIDLDELKFISILNKSIAKYEFKEAMLEVFSPFLEKVGILWQAGDVVPAQEHFVSNLVRQKIIAAIEALPINYNPEARRFLLFLPENEWHEIGLLFAYYLIREMGHDVLYLGQSVPYSDVLATGAARDFDCILVSSTIPVQDFDFVSYLKDLGGAFPDKQIMFFSSLPIHGSGHFGGNYHHLYTLSELQGRIKEIYS
jgi:DNA-binding transcriptional MerR regulator